jgi:hypothetical protein
LSPDGFPFALGHSGWAIPLQNLGCGWDVCESASEFSRLTPTIQIPDGRIICHTKSQLAVDRQQVNGSKSQFDSLAGHLMLQKVKLREKVASRVVLLINSYDLHGIRFLDENELESLFFNLNRLLFLSRVMAVFFPVSDFWGLQFHTCRQFHTCPQFHTSLYFAR